MIKIHIKPISQNEAYKGRKFKTSTYHAYEKLLTMLLPARLEVPEGGKLEFRIKVGLSSKNADGDNPIKSTQDIIAKKYKFNDKRIYRWIIEKIDTAKGAEFIEFEILKLEQQ
jgi:hypothetical protein